MKIKKYIPVLIIMIIFVIVQPVAAADDPTIVTGTEALLKAALGWLLGLIPAGAGCVIGYHALAKQLNEGDPGKVSQHNQAMKNTLIGAAIGMTAAGTVAAILAFF